MNGRTVNVPSYENPEGHLKFLTYENETYLYKNLYGFTFQLQKKLESFDLSESSPLLIVADSRPETVFLIASCFLLKIPILPLHSETNRFELTKVLEEIKPGAVYSNGSNHRNIFENIPVIEVDKEMMKTDEDPGNIPFSLSDPENVAGYFLTSGSTGLPKIVPVKRRQIFFAASSSAKNFKPSKNRYWLLCLPLNHVGGINVIYRSILYHSAIYLMASFDVDHIRKCLHYDESFEVASMVPTMLVQLMEDSFFRVHFNYKAILLGGGPISMELINQSLTRGLPIVCSYGMTETCAQIAANPMLQPSGLYIPKKSVGSVFEPNKIEIRNSENKSLPYNESGYIWLKGPQVFDGYLNDIINRAFFDDDGWFKTGDYGHINRKGQLFIENRRTDLIISGGENINPTEVEEVLNSFDGIQEAAVVGVPDKKWGQKVVAFLILENNQVELDKDRIEKGLKESLRKFKIPKELIIVDRLPKTSTQKIQRAKLVELYERAQK